MGPVGRPSCGYIPFFKVLRFDIPAKPAHQMCTRLRA